MNHSAPLPRPMDLSHRHPTRKPVQNYPIADVNMDEALVYMPAFSVDSSGQGRTRNDLRGYDEGRYFQQSAPPSRIQSVSRPPSVSPSVTPKLGGPPSGPRYMSVISNKSQFNGIALMVRPPGAKSLAKNDPFKDLPPNPPLPTIYTTAPSPTRDEHGLIQGPFVTKALKTPPPRIRKDGRGHRRGLFTAITNVAQLNCTEVIAVYPVITPIPPSPVCPEPPDHPPIQGFELLKFTDPPYPLLQDSPSPTTITSSTPALVHSHSLGYVDSPSLYSTEPSTPSPSSAFHSPLLDSPYTSVFDTPLLQQRNESLSLKRRPAYEDLHSPSPPRSSFKKRSISRLWFNPPDSRSPSPTGTSPPAITPLHVIKRGGISKLPTLSFSPSLGLKSSPTEDDMRDVVAKVRAVFDILREDEEDEGDAARELLNRDSSRTCESGPAPNSPGGGRSTQVQQPGVERRVGDSDEESDGEEYGSEVNVRSICSPPPPYALSSNLSPPDVYASLKRDSPLDAFRLMDESYSYPSQEAGTKVHSPIPKAAAGLRRQKTGYPETNPPAHDHSRRLEITLQVTPSTESPTVTPAVSTELTDYNESPSPSPLCPTASNLTLTTAVSTELSYLNEECPTPRHPPSPVVVVESVDPTLDDILVSFEELMQSMGIKSRPTTPEPTKLFVPPSPRSLRSVKPVKSAESRPETGFYVYGGLAEECDAQWCDLLELDSYDSR